MTRIYVGLALSWGKLFFLMENIYVQFEGMTYKQMMEIQIGTKCAPVIADCCFILL